MLIETNRLFLRELTPGDQEAMYAVLGDRDIMKYYPYDFDGERVREWIDRNIERYRVFGFGLWAVCLKGTGELIGDCGLTMQIIDGVIRPEIGYHIRADMQRQGFASEAARAVRDAAFRATPFRMLYSYMESGNIPSRRTAESYGARYAGTYTENGREMCCYALSREDHSLDPSPGFLYN